MVRYHKPWRIFISIVREAFPYIGLTFVILTTLVFVQQVGKYSNIILSYQASTQAALKFLMSLLPGIMIITLPVALLLGTVITCSRLSADSELVAAQALGVSQLSLSFPFLFFGIIGTIGGAYLSAEVAPKALRDLKSMRAKILLEEASTQIRPHMFITSYPNVLLFVQDVDRRTGEWLGVFILQQDPRGNLERLITAERGRLSITSAPRVSLEAVLLKGLTLESRGSPGENAGGTSLPAADPETRETSVFDKLSIKLTEKEPDTDEAGEMRGALNEMSLGAVGRQARGASDPKDRVRASVEWHKRFAFPFACLTLTMVTFIVSLRGRRFTTRPRTVVAILFIAMGFYLLLISGQNMASSGAVPVWLGVWFSNIVLGGFVIKSFATSKKLIQLPHLSHYFSSFFPLSALRRYFEGVIGRFRKAGPLGVANPEAPVRFSLINLINYLIVSEIAKYYMLALLALLMTSIIFTLFDLIPAMARSGTSIGYTAGYLGYLSPQLTYHVSPFAMLVAILTGCSVLARTNQLVILSGAGLSKSRLLTAILMAALTLAAGLWFMSDYILPHTNREQDIRYHKIKSRQLEQTTLAFGKKWVYGEHNIIYSYQRIDADNTLYNTSMFYISPSRGVLEKANHFLRATQDSPDSWRPADGWSDRIRDDLTIERLALSPDQPIKIDDGADLFRRTVNESSKMSSTGLSNYIRQLSGIGIATPELEIDLKKRLAFPFSCLTLALIAVPFATSKRARKSSTLASIALGVVISLVFWLLMTIFEAAGKQANLPVTLAVWGPQIMFLALGMYLNFRHRLH